MAEELTPLSEREMEILRLVATGATNQQIAQELVISANTVKVHLRNIYAKLEVASRTEATMVAVRRGWVQVPRPPDQVEEEEGREQARGAALLSTLLRRERWPRVAVAKRAALVAAVILAIFGFLLPGVIQSQTGKGEQDPFNALFPTEPADTLTTRWRTRAHMPTPRTNLAVVACDGLVYAIGGVSNDGVTGKVEVYDPKNDAWSSRQPKPVPAGFIAAAVLEGKIYVPGGVGDGVEPLNLLEVYDPAQDAWETGAPLPEPLGAYALAVLDGRLYLFGGRGRQGYTAAAYRYDPQADRWEALRPMAQPRGFLGAAALQGRIYVVGGYNNMAEFNTCEAYTPATDTWTPCAPMAMRRGGLAVVAVREHLFAIGGGMTGYLAFNERYDPRFDTWSRIETPVTKQWQGLGAAFVSPNIYAIGGRNEVNLSVNEAYQALFVIPVPISP